MSDLPILGTVVLASYFTGALPFGYLIARWRGVDILKQGSGNIGATNVGRVLGRRYGILAFILDFAKGALPVAVAAWLSKGHSNLPQDSLEVCAGLAAFLGHLFPIYLRFRGGKGVATGAGVVTVLLPGAALAVFLAWAVTVIITRYVSLASLAAAAVLCIIRLVSTAAPFAPENRSLTLFCLLAGGLVFLRHRANIARLLRGTENRLTGTSTMFTLAKLIHVLSLALWFGSVVFFSLVATPVVFQTFGSLADRSTPERPGWLPDSFDKEKATQLAGLAVGPIFPWYYLLQGTCGLLAAATAVSWLSSEPSTAIHKVRFFILAVALATVLVGWPIAQKVAGLRAARYAADTAVATGAKAEFATWHTYSLLLNFVTLLLVSVAMALAAWLPVCVTSSGPAPVSSSLPQNYGQTT